MLVLSRKVGESIHIGDNVVVTVVKTSSGTVRLGIKAPDDITIVREELKKRKEEAAGVQRDVQNN